MKREIIYIYLNIFKGLIKKLVEKDRHDKIIIGHARLNTVKAHIALHLAFCDVHHLKI